MAPANELAAHGLMAPANELAAMAWRTAPAPCTGGVVSSTFFKFLTL